MGQKENPPGRVKARVTMAAVKTHGPNSPDVISGKVPLGHQEEIHIEPSQRLIELSEQEVRESLGDEIADEWFGRVDGK